MGKPGGGASREMTPHAGLEARWREPRTTGEVLDALWGYMAVSFTLRPWDWTGMTVYRVLHEEQYFGGQASSKEHQKELCEEFIDTVLRESRAILQQGKHHMSTKV